jgi:hypothetical protein
MANSPNNLNGWTSLNVVGNWESTSPGIGERVEHILLVVFARLGEPDETVGSETTK